MITITVEGKNVADLWRLKCVKEIGKYGKEDNLRVLVAYKKRTEAGMYAYHVAYTGSKIKVETEQSEIGKVDI